MTLKLKSLTASIVLTFVHLSASAFHIVVDAGHGGIDTGAVYGPAREADLVLKIAQELNELLRKNPDFRVTMTRDQDKMISLPKRVEIAETTKADLFVSLHANAATDPRAKGVEFFFQNNLPPDEDSLFLASQENQMQNSRDLHAISGGDELSKKGDLAAIIEDLHRQSRMSQSLNLTKILRNEWLQDPAMNQSTIKQAPFYVISKTSMPSVLIEVGFLSNPRESKKLLKAEYQTTLAQKIYSALQAFKEKMDNTTPKTLD